MQNWRGFYRFPRLLPSPESLPVFALVAAVLLYGVGSQPAPSGLGPVEGGVAGLLLLAVGLQSSLTFASGAFLADPRLQPFEALAGLCFLILLWIGLARGLFLGARAGDVIRDVLPLGFLFLPVLVARAFPKANIVDAVADAVAVAGVALAVRWWVEVGLALHFLGDVALVEGKRYLLNSNAVPFAAVWCSWRGLQATEAGANWWRWPYALSLLIGGAICLAALAAAVHRASVLMAAMALAVGVSVWIFRRPRRLLVLLPLLAIVSVFWADNALGVVDLILRKTATVGLNSREAEVAAVLAEATGSLPSFLFGQGWGGLLSNPAVGGWLVSYTHASFSYFLFKTGIIGLVAFWMFLLAWLIRVLPALIFRPDLALALVPVLASGLFLHTGYKYLCFGLCLSLPLLVERHVKNVAKNGFIGKQYPV